MQVVLFNALSSEPEDDRCIRLTGVAGGLQVIQLHPSRRCIRPWLLFHCWSHASMMALAPFASLWVLADISERLPG